MPVLYYNYELMLKHQKSFEIPMAKVDSGTYT